MRNLIVALSMALALVACGDSKEQQQAKQIQQLQAQVQAQQQALQNGTIEGLAMQNAQRLQSQAQAPAAPVVVQQSSGGHADSGMKDALLGGAIGYMAGSMMGGGNRSTETRVVEREVYRDNSSNPARSSAFGYNPGPNSRSAQAMAQNAPVSPAIGSSMKPSIPSAPTTPNFAAPGTPKPIAPVVPTYKPAGTPNFTPSTPSSAYGSSSGSSYKAPTSSYSYKSSPSSTPSRSFSSGSSRSSSSRR